MSDELKPPTDLRRRVSFNLTFKRAVESREWHESGLRGPQIDDSLADGQTVPGGWDALLWENLPENADEEEWLAEMLTAVMAEGVHEVLEWFMVDGERYLNPHGPTALEVHRKIMEFTQEIVKIRRSLRETVIPDSSQQRAIL